MEDKTMLPVMRSNFPTFVADILGDDLMSNFLNEPVRKHLVPAVNIAETQNEFRVEVAAP